MTASEESPAGPPPRSFWVGVVSRAHVLLGVEGGFIQLNHGKKAPLTRFKAGDGLVRYSPRTTYPDGEVLQAFTAIGRIKSAVIYQVEMTPDFEPYRIDVDFFACDEAPVRPLIDELSFIRSKTHWGAAFRFGQVKIARDDFFRIAEAMRCEAFAADRG